MPTAVTSLTPSPPQPLRFAPSLHVRSFLLSREHGDVLVYSSNGLATAFPGAAIARQYLGHSHEAMFAEDPVGAPVFVHEDDLSAVGDALDVRATFSRRHTLDEDFEVIPIPGHTPGSTAYLWNDGERRYLFTADSIYLSGGGWVDGLLDSSDRDAYLRSLEALREEEFDVLVPWAAPAGEAWFAETDPADARRRIDALIKRVSRTGPAGP